LAARIKEFETLQNDAKSNHQTATAQIPALTREKTQLSNPTTTDSAAIERMQTIIDNIGTKLKELSSEKSELDAKLKLNQELDVILGDSGIEETTNESDHSNPEQEDPKDCKTARV